MEHQSTGEYGVKIYTPPTPPPPPSYLKPTTRSLPPPVTIGNPTRNKRQAVAKGVHTTLSKTSTLAHFLPSGTLITFEMVLPSIYRTGQCSTVSTVMMIILLCLCIMSCFFFHFTDSFRSPEGKVFYGFVTPGGLMVFQAGLVEVPKDDKYRIQFADLVHAMMSVMVFSAIAFSDHRVISCLLPEYEMEMQEAMESFPLMVGIVCSCLFLVFPKARFGVGCMAS